MSHTPDAESIVAFFKQAAQVHGPEDAAKLAETKYGDLPEFAEIMNTLLTPSNTRRVVVRPRTMLAIVALAAAVVVISIVIVTMFPKSPKPSPRKDVTFESFRTRVQEAGGIVEGDETGVVLKIHHVCDDEQLAVILELASGFDVMTVDVSESTAITDTSLRRIVHLSALKFLYLQKTSVTGDGVKLLAKMSNIQELQLPGVQTIDDAALKDLPPRLLHLMLDETSITNEGLRHIAHLQYLRALYLNDVPGVSDEGVGYLANSKISRLELARTAITNTGLDHLARMSSLVYVDLSDCRGVTEAGVSDLQSQRPELTIRR